MRFDKSTYDHRMDEQKYLTGAEMI
jgi:hypothetical protein